MKKVLSFLFLFMFSFVLASCSKTENTNIVSTCFAGYDFSRAVAKDLKTTSMLLKPGQELHNYSPSVGEIEKILDSEIFIYIGGESDSEWVEEQILPSIDKNKTKVINMMEAIKASGSIYDEEDPESSVAEEDEEEVESDEHIWNSISNAKIIIEEICKVLKEIDDENKTAYENNKNEYINKLEQLDTKIKGIDNLGSKPLIFADRFPLLYFVKEYNLSYDAAFKGCATSKEANASTISSLINKIKDNDVKVIFVIELSESKIANTIIKELKNDKYEVAKLTFYSMHNVSKDDFKSGKTYVDFMEENYKSLIEAYK